MGLHWATPGHLLNTDVFLGDINQFVAKVGKKLSTLETPHLINQLCPEAFLIRTFLGPIETCSFNSNSGQFLPMESILLSLSAIFALPLLRTICGRVCVYTRDKRYHLQSPHKSSSVPRQRQQRSTASVQTQHSLSTSFLRDSTPAKYWHGLQWPDSGDSGH